MGLLAGAVSGRKWGAGPVGGRIEAITRGSPYSVPMRH